MATDWNHVIDITEKLFTIIAVIVGGLWVYFNSFRGRTFVPRLQLELSGKLVSRGNRCHLAGFNSSKERWFFDCAVESERHRSQGHLTGGCLRGTRSSKPGRQGDYRLPGIGEGQLPAWKLEEEEDSEEADEMERLKEWQRQQEEGQCPSDNPDQNKHEEPVLA